MLVSKEKTAEKVGILRQGMDKRNTMVYEGHHKHFVAWMREWGDEAGELRWN